MFVLSAVFAIMFLLPTVLTITNSFMTESEINSNYGMIFSTTTGGYVSERVNLMENSHPTFHRGANLYLTPPPNAKCMVTMSSAGAAA